MKGLIIFVLLFYFSYSFGQTISVYESFVSAGVKVTLPSGYDSDKTSQTVVEYKKTSETTWKAGFHFDRITAQSVDQFRGSLFGLEESINYDLRVTLVDSIPIISSSTLPVFTFTTLTSPTFNASANIKWVSPGGSGTVYSQSSPGNLKVLLGSGTLTCGTTIYCKDGTYKDFNMGLNVTTDCTEGTPIQILAEPGANPIFDGAHPASFTWIQNSSDSKLFAASLPTGTDFTNICHINGELLYPYATLFSNVLIGGYNLSDLSFGADGFVRDGSTIWLKTEAGLNPNTETIIISRAFRWLTIYGNNHNLHLKIKGLTIRNYGKSNVSGTVAYSGMAADFRLVNNVTFDDCHFQKNNADIRFDGICNDILVQGCSFENNNGKYSHAMSKKSNDDVFSIATSHGRSKETGAIKIFETKGLTLRNNHFNGTNSGVVSSYETGFVEEVDIYDNIFESNFDAIECDGFWSNLRAWNNEIISPMAAFSIAQPKIGPRYFYRNVVHHLNGRINVQNDPYFVGCSAPTNYWSAAVGIKTNSGPVPGDSSDLYFINNTFYSDDTLGFVFTMWDSEWKSINFINNILLSETRHLGYFHDLANKPNYQMKWDHNNFFVNSFGQGLMVAKEVHGQYNCHSIFNINQLQSELNSISGSTRFSFTNSYNSHPSFISTVNGGFFLNSSSSMVDAGIAVKGFYDYNGIAPDLGAKETIGTNSLSEEIENSQIVLFPNPNAGSFKIRTSNELQNATLRVYSLDGSLVAERTDLNGKECEIKAQLPRGMYIVNVLSNEDVFVKRLVVE